MFRAAVVTLFPGMFRLLEDYGIMGRAIKGGMLGLRTWDPRGYTTDVHRTVDDRPYGGGPGMVLMAPPLQQALAAARQWLPAGSPAVYLGPQGRRLDQAGVAELSACPGLLLLAGRYEGVDERLIEAEIDQEWSVGDYVLSGGELAAMVLIDAVARQLPGVLGNDQSARQDSFRGGLLDYPQYTRPGRFAGRAVPEVLLSGDHERIRRWRRMQALGRTWARRPDLLRRAQLSAEDQALLEEYRRVAAANNEETMQ